jgi:hypothetical protein
MKMNQELYDAIIAVMLTSASSSDTEDFGIIIQDIKPILTQDWHKQLPLGDMDFVIQRFNENVREQESDALNKAIGYQDIIDLQSRCIFYPIDDDMFHQPLNLNHKIYLAKKEFMVPQFSFWNKKFDQFMFEPKFTLVYENNDEFIPIDCS